MLLNPVVDHLHHCIELRLHLLVRESEESNTKRLERSLPLFIFRSLQHVAGTVDLDRKHQLARKEIDDVAINGLLPVEIKSLSLPAVQLLPKQHLSQRAAISQLTREPFEARVVLQSHEVMIERFAPAGKSTPRHTPPRWGTPLHRGDFR